MHAGGESCGAAVMSEVDPTTDERPGEKCLHTMSPPRSWPSTWPSAGRPAVAIACSGDELAAVFLFALCHVTGKCACAGRMRCKEWIFISCCCCSLIDLSRDNYISDVMLWGRGCNFCRSMRAYNHSCYHYIHRFILFFSFHCIIQYTSRKSNKKRKCVIRNTICHYYVYSMLFTKIQ